MFLLAMLLAGMPTGAISSLGSFFPAYLAYVACSVLPFALNAMLSFEHYAELTSLVGLIFSGFLLRMSAINNANLRENIAQRLRLEALTGSLVKARDAAESASRAKSSFLANMSHEIRTPLNAVVGISELLQDITDSPRTVAYAGTIRKSALSLLGVINDVLDLSRIEAGGLSLRPESFCVRTLLNEILDMFVPVAHGKRLTLSLQIAPVVPEYVMADPVRLRQVLVNLLGNALKFTQAGDVRVKVDSTATDGRHRLSVAVADTGAGLSPEQQIAIFQPFTQIDLGHVKAQGGTGLGLTITAELVSLMGGQLKLESTPGEGSVFVVDIPVTVVDATAMPAALPPTPPVRRTDTPRVLLVEDNPVNQLVASEMLMSLGCTVRVANSGQESLRAMADEPFDLVFMDCQMPEMDGFEATRRWRLDEALRGSARLPVVALTANAILGDREDCLAAGMDDYLPKPVSREQLAVALKRYVAETDPLTA
jgi:signal transduction histidine kinase/ActR/RegA family two-component response regulator